MYIVYQESIYRHRIFGVFDDLEEAKRIAYDAVLVEHDHFHTVSVAEISHNYASDDVKPIVSYWNAGLRNKPVSIIEVNKVVTYDTKFWEEV